MVVIDRLDWIARQVSWGRVAHLSVGRAADQSKIKIKVTLHPASTNTCDVFCAEAVVAFLSAIRPLLCNNIAVDRGHRHSDGTSVISFWIEKSVAGKSHTFRANAAAFSPVTQVDCDMHDCDDNHYVKPERVNVIGTWTAIPESAWKVVYDRFESTDSATCEALRRELEVIRFLCDSEVIMQRELTRANSGTSTCRWANEVETLLHSAIVACRCSAIQALLCGQDDYKDVMANGRAIIRSSQLCKDAFVRWKDLYDLISCYIVRMKRYSFIQTSRADRYFDPHTFDVNIQVLGPSLNASIVDELVARFCVTRNWISSAEARTYSINDLYCGLGNSDRIHMDLLMRSAIRDSGFDQSQFVWTE
eukprot:TRINITY_DN9791_c0_g1_i1.p1 TRINITY_DN9791_c0_g1~~TRINITY_DN9791_c0_g1_i1.p1  ORF type:complete len:382 (-),score=24.17 TRINITY_DN9791_c0_g1_i1:155-1240(-)